MHGGLKVYRGSPAAARSYVEADRGRADDYYLAEGTGVAQRYDASPEAGVRNGGTLDGDAYEAWVAGYDPATGAPKGRVRSDAAAVRFVEVVVNGPKSWSLAAALDPEIAAAYDRAQDRAAEQVIGWLAQHATTRVGPRGHQLQVPVQEIEAAVVRHYTSRAGDPHRHLHLQINARVFAENTWRGLHTVGVRDSLGAINGIGHAAVMCDPDFRAALADRGFTLDTDSGEIVELAGFVGPFSARAAQIGRNVERFEATWRAAHPGAEPGPRLRRSWDARAWAQDRPDKVVPKDGADLARAWVQELAGLGYHDPDPARIPAAAAQPVRVGALDRDGAARDVLTRLGAARSGWNAADVRGQVEQLIAASGIVAGGPARLELAEDLTARALDRCVPLLGRRGLPEHIRALTSQQVLDVEADLCARFIARAADSGRTVAGNVPAGTHPRAHQGAQPRAPRGAHPGAHSGEGLAGAGLGWKALDGLDAGQRQVVAAMAGGHRLLVIEGAAGAGKTTTLAATRTALDRQGRQLVVVTPTLKAATIATHQVGAPALSAAWLAHQHGYRWNTDRAWTRLRVGDPDPLTGHTYTGPQPGAVLTAGDLLLVDEAGMLDQDSARALMVIADEQHARVALVGDRHQLPAVGRGGVLDLAARWANPEACLTLEAVHRFADPAYAHLSLSMRTGTPQAPGVVFDALLARGEIRVYPTPAARTEALAAIAAAATATRATTGNNSNGGGVLLVADTREQVADLNGHIRERLVAGGHVDDTHVVTTWAGERIGVGDQIVTRRNDRDADVANRDTWTVTRLVDDGAVVVGSRGQRVLRAAYVRDHVELAYASTVYGAQGSTTNAAHLVVGEHTGAAGAYVAMTRGRDHNTAHLVADTPKEARDQWIEVFNRDRADLGPAHAARLAAQEATPYATHRPLGAALSDLREAWTQEHTLAQDLTAARREYDQLAEVVPLRAQHDAQVAAGRAIYEQARGHANQAAEHADQFAAVVRADSVQLAGRLHQEWDTDRPAARAAAKTIEAGTGRIGQHRRAVRQASDHLQAWAETWRPIVAWLPTDADELAVLAAGHGDPSLGQALTAYARTVAEGAHPDHAPAQAAAHAARQTAEQASDAYNQTRARYPAELAGHGDLAWLPDPAGHLAETQLDVAELTGQLGAARGRVRAALADPAVRSLPQERIETELERWATGRFAQSQEEHGASDGRDVAPSPTSGRRHERSAASYAPKPGRGIGR
jgi:conjugative relaxase-like TrwC/TraI family protein